MKDSLTKLSSINALEAKLQSAKHPKLFVIDIKGFNAINLEHGDEGGDALLCCVAQALEHFADANTMSAYRLKNDQYALLLEKPFELEMLESAIQSLLDLLEGLVCTHSLICIKPQFHIGISFDHFNTLEKAHKALMVAKTHHQAFATYSEFANTLMSESLEEIEKAIKEAIGLGKITLFFQPIFSTHTKSILYYESLLRLACNERLESPRFLVHVARQKGLYDLLLQAIAEKIAFSARTEPYALNVSGEDLLTPERFTFLCHAFRGLPVVFELEWDETCDMQALLIQLAVLKNEGFFVALDNVNATETIKPFSREHVDYVKIHGSIIRNLQDTATHKQCQALLEQCHEKGFGAIATQINSETITSCVASLPFDYMQGYWLEKPRPL